MRQTIISKQTPHVSIVLLLHVSLVVFKVGARTCLVDSFLLQPVVNMIVEELSSVVAIQS